MKLRVLALALVATPGAAQQLQPTTQDVREAITAQSYVAYPEGDIEAWRRDLRADLTHLAPDAAADALAAKYGFASGDMRRLVRAWIIAQARQYDPEQGWTQSVRAELYALAPTMRGKPVGLAILAEALDATTEDCRADDFDTLMAGSTDSAADGYVIATAASCLGNFARAAIAAGDRATPALIRTAEFGGLPPRDALPLYAWLTSPAALAHVREADRPAVAAFLWQRYLTALFDADMASRALAAFDALPADLRAAVVSPAARPELTAVVDGITMTFAAEGDDGTVQNMRLADALSDQADMLEGDATEASPEPGSPAPAAARNLSALDAPILQLAEAMAIAGRDDEARRLLGALPGLAEAKASATCQYESTPDTKQACPDSSRLPMGALPLDHLLNAPDADPYPIAETTLSGEGGFGRGASAAILCKVFPTKDYPGLCPQARNQGYFSETITTPEELAVSEAALDRAIPGFAALRASILGPHDAPAPAATARLARDTVAAIPPDFVEKPIPAADRGSAAPVALAGLAPLPDGFQLVRAERSGRRVVAISVSQTYDPTGEVSQGGYWVHISDDGGKHWDRPLYTGLADRFPYVVAPASRLPLIAGDTLQLAVDIAEIDTASITYPPVALRTRRRAKDRYLTIPLADLRKDSDGDGVTDIAAHHLLLDRAPSAGGAPFVLGSDYRADCRAAPSAEKLALVALLGRITGASDAAIVEPVDRPPGELMTGWRRAAASEERPLFLLGRPQDFACLTSKRLIIVYDKADIAALERFTPDFHALEMPRIVFNRAHDRGYVRWSTGWAGGTYRLRRIDGAWRFDAISSWIT